MLTSAGSSPIRSAHARNLRLAGLRTRLVEEVVCPDSKSSCPDRTTCCLMSDGQYGCCPMPKAVCCNDHLHCCPHGSRCDVAKETCVRAGGQQQAWLTKTPARQASPTVSDVPCPGGGGTCPDHYTCCSIGGGQYGCCSYENATCCGDKKHCCPHGTRCVGSGSRLQCVKDQLETTTSHQQRPRLLIGQKHVIGWPESSLARPLTGEEAGQTPLGAIDCGKGVSCPEGTTCCDMVTGEPGCCPVPHAICCADQLHCCPAGLVCQQRGAKCAKPDGSLSIQALTKFPATRVSQP